jgi:hypothetical protein
MKPGFILMIFVALMASFVAGYLTRMISHEQAMAGEAAKAFRKTEHALDGVFQIDSPPRNAP